MKKLIVICILLILGVSVHAQSKGKYYALETDTVKGAEAVSFDSVRFKTSQKVLTIDAVCTQLGGTSDGTLTLYGSNNGTDWVFINGAADGEILTASPKASLTGTDMNQITITNSLVASWVVKDLPYIYYKPVAVGTSGDTTKIATSYIYK